MSTGAEIGLLAKYGGYLISFLGSLGAGAWFWNWKKNTDKGLSDLRESQTKSAKELRDSIKILSDTQINHSNKFLTEEAVRDEIERSLTPMRDSVSNIERISMGTQEAVIELAAQLREKTAVDKALAEFRRQQE